MVAGAVFMVWKPRVDRMTCLSVPWSASMMLFRYLQVRCFVLADSLLPAADGRSV